MVQHLKHEDLIVIKLRILGGGREMNETQTEPVDNWDLLLAL